MLANKKSSILLVLKVLEEYSDEEHYLTQNEIVDLIYKLYDIELERKSVGSSLELLSELDYDIDKAPKGGFALLSRTFDSTEASFIIDAIFSSKSIDGRQAKKIADQVSSCFSKYQRKDYSYLYKSSEINRTENKQVLFNISIIQEAIKKGKRIGFQYMSYDDSGNKIIKKDGFQYIVSPYFLINNFGRYYLLCNYREKYHPLQSFRIDNMTNVVVKDDWNIKSIDDLVDLPKNFSISNYINEHIYLFAGDAISCELELDNENAVSFVKDWFGNNAKINKEKDKIIAKIKCNETALYYWIMQYSDCITVKTPESLRKRVIEGLKEGLKRYEK